MPADPPEDKRAKDRTPRRRRRWWVLPLVLLAIVAAAPTLIGLSPARDSLLASLVPPEAGTITTTGGSFGWFGANSLTGVQLNDAAGQPLLIAERVGISNGLFSLLTDPNGALRVAVDKPIVSVMLDPTGSNIEKFLTVLDQHDEPAVGGAGESAAESKKRLVSFEVTDAELRITDASTHERWLATGVSINASGIGQGFAALKANVVGKIAPYVEPQAAVAPPTPGEFAMRLGVAEDGRRLASLHLVSTPLGVVGSFLRRSDPNARLSGWVGIEGQAAWAPGIEADDLISACFADGFGSTGATTVTNLEYSGALTGDKPLRTPRLEAPWSVGANSGKLTVSRLRGESDLGAVEARGELSQQEVRAWVAGRPLPPDALQMKGLLDIAQIAAVAPEVLRLQQGVRIDSGRVLAELTSDGGGSAPRLTGVIRTENLVGVARGAAVSWDDPLEVSFTATQRASEPGSAWWVENLRCQSVFLRAEASGDTSGVRGSGRFDLDRLASELRKFVDLGDCRLAGTGEAEFTWRRRAAPGAWTATASGELNEVVIGSASAPILAEQRVDFNASVAGVGAELTTYEAADIILDAGDDRLRLILEEAPGESGPFRFELVGDLTRWAQRVWLAAPSLPLEGIAFGGRIEASGSGARENQLLQVTQLKALAVDLALDTPDGVRVREPRIEFEGGFVWNAETGVLISNAAQLVGSAVSLRTREVTLSPSGPPDASRGEAVFRGDLGRLMAWLPASEPDRWTADGAFTGGVNLHGEEQGVRFAANLSGENLALYQQTAAGRQAVWSEPQLQANVRALVGHNPRPQGDAAIAVALDQMTLASQTLSASVAGGVGDLGRLAAVDLAGEIEYDLEQLTPLLWPRLGDGVKLYGKDKARFEVSSDAASEGLAGLIASVDAPWQGADLFGLPVGAGRLKGSLERGAARFDPLAVTLGDGSLTAAVSATVSPSPSVVSLAPGPAITGVAISPEVAERFLKFVAPVLADATRINGRFSVGFSEFTLLPSDALQTRMTGNLEIHRAEVAPGPGVSEWVSLARQVRGVVRDGVEGVASPASPFLTIEEQSIPFQMADGRVHHSGLEFHVGDVIVYSEGSVGVDETLDLLLSIPILEEWVQRRPVLLGGLRGQAIRIPVRGTLSRPELDKTAFRDLSRQLLQSAAEGAINQGLDLLLERLRSR